MKWEGKQNPQDSYCENRFDDEIKRHSRFRGIKKSGIEGGTSNKSSAFTWNAYRH
jgi:hypothetical protein